MISRRRLIQASVPWAASALTGGLMSPRLLGAGDYVSLSEGLPEIVQRYGVPSVAVAVFSTTDLMACGASGRRMRDAATPVTVADKYHWGSCTKSMTAVLCALAVEEKKLSWNTLLAERLGDVPMNEGWKVVTLEHLIRHQSGMPRTIPDALWAKLRASTESALPQRLMLARGTLAQKPSAAPGRRFEYSNVNYVLAGMMVERAYGTSWEALVRKRLFGPLGMKSMGFGAPAQPDKVDQPWGHRSSDGQPVRPGPLADNMAALAPAGGVHGSLLDMVKYGQMHLAANGGGPRILSAQSLQWLHGVGQGSSGYFGGWERHARSWAGGDALYHNGTNTMFYAVVWLAPARGYGLIAACNAGGSGADKACDAAVGDVGLKWLKQQGV